MIKTMRSIDTHHRFDNPNNEIVFTYLTKARGEPAKAIAFTGCTDLSRMDPTVIHRSPF